MSVDDKGRTRGEVTREIDQWYLKVSRKKLTLDEAAEKAFEIGDAIVPKLLETLDSRSARLREIAAYSLARFDLAPYLDRLLTMFQLRVNAIGANATVNPATKVGAFLWLFSRFAHPRIFEALTPLLEHKNTQLVQQVSAILANLYPEQAAEPILEAARNFKIPSFARQALDFLLQNWFWLFFGYLFLWHWLVGIILVWKIIQSLPKVFAMTGAFEPLDSLVVALCKIGDVRAVGFLSAYIRRRMLFRGSMLSSFIQMLEKIDDVNAPSLSSEELKSLRYWAHDPNASVAIAAIKALGFVGDDTALANLKALKRMTQFRKGFSEPLTQSIERLEEKIAQSKEVRFLLRPSEGGTDTHTLLRPAIHGEALASEQLLRSKEGSEG